MILTPGGRDKNELPSSTDPAHWAEQRNLVSPLMHRSKTNVWMLSVRRALGPHRMGPPVSKSCWQADGLPDQNPIIWDLGSLTLQAVTTGDPLPPSPSHKWIQRTAMQLVPQWKVEVGVLGPCFLPEDAWSGQSWSRPSTVQGRRSGMFLLFFFFFFRGNHRLSRMTPAYGNATLLMSSLFSVMFRSVL